MLRLFVNRLANKLYTPSSSKTFRILSILNCDNIKFFSEKTLLSPYNQHKTNTLTRKIEEQEMYALSFSEFRFIQEIYQVLGGLNIQAPTSIQTVAIPRIMQGRHVFFASQTGTGKTLSYLLPLLHQLKMEELKAKTRLTTIKRPRAVILVPSRELAQQVEEVCKLFVYDVPLVVESFFVGKEYSTERKYSKSGIDILITTPERFENHWTKKNIYISRLTHVVIDELDTLLDAGDEDFLARLIKIMLKRNLEEEEESQVNNTQEIKRQIILASTTSTPSIDKFLDKVFSGYDGSSFVKIIDKSTNHNLSNVKHEFVQITNYDKLPTLLKIINDNSKLFKENLSMIIFCNNVDCTRKLGLFLEENGLSNSCIHGDIPPLRRKTELYKFKTRQTKILLCTDVMARGMDFPFVYLVINFDFPRTLSDYLHRVGRTGRGGRKGVAVSFYRKHNYPVIEKIKKAHQFNLPMDIEGSMYNLRTTKDVELKSRKRPSVGISNKIFPSIPLKSKETKRTAESLLIKLRKKREMLDKYREKMANDKNEIIQKMNKRNLKRGHIKRVAKLKKKLKFKIK